MRYSEGILISVGISTTILAAVLGYVSWAKRTPGSQTPPPARKTRQASCIIKLGGSACTDKDRFETCDFEQISRFSEQLVEVRVADDSFKPIVIHGGGSFGHFQAKQFSVSAGAMSDSGQPMAPDESISGFLREGFSKTRLSVTTLNHYIIKNMIQKGLPAVSVSPFPFIPVVKRRLRSSAWPWRDTLTRSLSEVLDLGLVPVLHGDACIDTGERRTGILSGDTLFMHLCEEFSPTHAVFLADVDGVLTGPPGTIPEPTLIEEILVDESGEWSVYDKLETSVRAHDVTGGILNKIDAAVQVVRKCRIPVYIVKAGTVHALQAIKGQVPPRGTLVRFHSA